MNHKCDGCKFKGEHQEMGFSPCGVCLKEPHLADAVASFNAKECPHNENKKMTEDEAEAMKAHIRLLESEIERLKKIINTSAIILPARKCGKTFLIKTTIEKITESARTAARAEAIKEFAERVKKKGFTNNFCKLLISAEEIDQIAKEMGVEL